MSHATLCRVREIERIWEERRERAKCRWEEAGTEGRGVEVGVNTGKN